MQLRADDRAIALSTKKQDLPVLSLFCSDSFECGVVPKCEVALDINLIRSLVLSHVGQDLLLFLTLFLNWNWMHPFTCWCLWWEMLSSAFKSFLGLCKANRPSPVSALVQAGRILHSVPTRKISTSDNPPLFLSEKSVPRAMISDVNWRLNVQEIWTKTWDICFTGRKNRHITCVWHHKGHNRLQNDRSPIYA